MSTISLASRQRQPELMDQPGIDEQAHRKALSSIKRLNEICRVAGVLWRETARVAEQRRLRKLSVLDLACGGGDLAIQLARLASRRRFDISIDGCDVSQTAVAHANKQAVAANVGNVAFHQQDVMSENLHRAIRKDYDIVMCSLFLHHLDERDAAHLLQQMTALARHAVLVDDLQRTRLGYALAWVGCRVFTRSPMVHIDGPLSVRSAFTIDEAYSLANRAGMRPVHIANHWPQRFMLTWTRTSNG